MLQTLAIKPGKLQTSHQVEKSLPNQSSMELSRKVAGVSPDPSVLEVHEKYMGNPCVHPFPRGVKVSPPKFESYKTSSIETPILSTQTTLKAVAWQLQLNLVNGTEIAIFQNFQKFFKSGCKQQRSLFLLLYQLVQ